MLKKNFSFLMFAFLFACTKDKKINEEVINASGYPKDVAEIMINKCATAGCHNTQSMEGAAGLDYSTWENMFKGGFSGASVIPYSTDYSFMLYFVNTDPAAGLSLDPKMPYNTTPLSKAEYQTLKNWIAQGAPDDKGFVKFSDNPDRQKFYVCMQACDQVAVFDAETRVIMRYIKVGVDPGIEAPHQIKITPDGKYWCAVFYSGHVFQIFNTSGDQLVKSVEIGSGQWNTVTFSHDSKTAYITSTDPFNSKIATVDMTAFTLTGYITGISSPHGSYVTKDGHFLYITSQYGNYINKVALMTFGSYSKGDIDLIQIKTTSPNADPHEIAFTPDESKYFLSCQNTNEVRVFNTANDSLLDFIPVGTQPQEFAFSSVRPYLFITCTEDPGTSSKGSVYVIDYSNLQIIGKVYPGYQPHGFAVDDARGLIYIANLNADPGGPAPHHASSCGGRNGWVSIINFHTLAPLQITYPSGNTYNYKNEALTYPYFVAYRK